MTAPDVNRGPTGSRVPAPGSDGSAADLLRGPVPPGGETPRAEGTGELEPTPRLLARLQQSIGESVIGSAGAVQALTIALSCDGHVLLEGLPGLAKTYLVRSFARSLDLSFRRIQFTPDMLPTDIVGNVVLSPTTHELEFRPGPVFCNVLLADEINRAPPKVQSALLETMQEFQVTVDGRTHPLPRPFLVIATQNPVEQEGTYPLPESQLDRFLFRYILGYPDRSDEVRILSSQGESLGREVTPGIASTEDIAVLRARHQDTYVSPDVLAYIADIIRETRQDARILVGASPRAGVHLLLAARALAILEGRRYVLPDDVRALSFSVLNHRIILRPEARRSRGVAPGTIGEADLLREIVGASVDRVKVPR